MFASSGLVGSLKLGKMAPHAPAAGALAEYDLVNASAEGQHEAAMRNCCLQPTGKPGS
jgi:hypothetical protein